MWNRLQEKVEIGQFGTMQPEQVLYEFEGPRIFVFRDKANALCLAYLSEELEHGLDRFIVVPTSLGDVSELQAGRISVREALTSQQLWVVDRNRAGQLSSAWAVAAEDLPPDAIPEPGVLLYAEQSAESFLESEPLPQNPSTDVSVRWRPASPSASAQPPPQNPPPLVNVRWAQDINVERHPEIPDAEICEEFPGHTLQDIMEWHLEHPFLQDEDSTHAPPLKRPA